MTHNQLKEEIQKAIELVPDTVLEDILGYLKQAQTNSSEGIELTRNLKKILSEDGELLQKLAQ